MRKMRGKTRYLVALAALAALGAGSLASSVTFALGGGRDKSQCLQTCNALGDACMANCPVACAAAYPAGSTEFAACTEVCASQCKGLPHECKTRCGSDVRPGGMEP